MNIQFRVGDCLVGNRTNNYGYTSKDTEVIVLFTYAGLYNNHEGQTYQQIGVILNNEYTYEPFKQFISEPNYDVSNFEMNDENHSTKYRRSLSAWKKYVSSYHEKNGMPINDWGQDLNDDPLSLSIEEYGVNAKRFDISSKYQPLIFKRDNESMLSITNSLDEYEIGGR